MSLKKPVAILTALCVLSAVNVLALAQDEDNMPAAESSPPPAVMSAATTTPAPAATPSTGAAPAVPNVFGTPETQRRVAVTQTIIKKTAASELQKALQKAEAEMHKAKIQLDNTLKDLQKSGDRAAMERARDELQRALQKAQDEMQKAKQQYDKTIKESGLINVQTMEPFIGRGGYGGASAGFGGRRVQLDSRTGQMMITGPDSLEIIVGPEANELREREENIKDEIHAVIEKYNGTQDKDERTNLRNKLMELVNHQFDIRQKCREMQVDRLEKELARIRESIQKRNENRRQIIQRHIAQLLNEEDEMAF